MAKNCDKMSTENRLKELRWLKERLVRLHKDATARQRLLRDVLPVAKSLKSGLLELSCWLDEADRTLASHCISGQLVAVVERINTHKVCFMSAIILLLHLSPSEIVAFISLMSSDWPQKGHHV